MNSELLKNLRQMNTEIEPELLSNPRSPDSIIKDLQKHLLYIYQQDFKEQNETPCVQNFPRKSGQEFGRSLQTDQIYHRNPQNFDDLTAPYFHPPLPPRARQNLNKQLVPGTSSTHLSQESRVQPKQVQNPFKTLGQNLSGLISSQEQVQVSGLKEVKKGGLLGNDSMKSFDAFACNIFRELVVLNIIKHYLRQFKIELPTPFLQLKSPILPSLVALLQQTENCNNAQNDLNESGYTSLSVQNHFNACRIIIANQMLINCLESEAERLRVQNKGGPRQQLHNELVMLKIKKSKVDLMSHLEEVPQMEQRVFKGSPREEARRNGTPYVSSNYRGVCRNGSRFQLFLMVDGKNKLYRGGFKDALTAAKLYDRASIQLRGLGAKTNFDYTKEEVIEILNSKPVFDVYQESDKQTQIKGV